MLVKRRHRFMTQIHIALKHERACTNADIKLYPLPDGALSPPEEKIHNAFYGYGVLQCRERNKDTPSNKLFGHNYNNPFKSLNRRLE